MQIEIGDEVIWADMTKPEVREGTITRLSKDLAWVDNQHKAEDCMYADYLWPARVRAELLEILEERQRLKKASDDSITLLFELRNKIGRGEL